MSEPARGQARIEIEVEAARDFNLAMVANSVPVVRRLALTNPTDEALRDLTVEVRLEPAFSATWSTHISEIAAGGTYGLEAVDLVVDRATLVNQLERSDANLMVRVRAPSGEEIASHAAVVSVLAYNEWSRNTVPQILAAFVMPNHPAVARILTTAKDRIATVTGSPALDGYQSHSSARVQGLAQGIYETIQAFDITYSNPPASFETTGQKIRTPEQVLEQRMGTCLDLSVLLAACLEQVGLNPLILVLQGHALPAVWLQEHTMPEGATDDGVRLRKHADLGMLLVFDSSAVASRPLVPFAQAVRRGRAYLDEETFRYAVDIRGARQQQFLPLPARVVGAYSTVEAAPTTQAPPSSSGRVVAAAVGTQSGSGQARAAKIPRIETWKQRLLDTSLRNRLLNFKKDGKQVLRLMGKDLPAIEDALARGTALQLWPRPTAFGKHDPRAKRLVDERLGEDPLEVVLREALAKGVVHVDTETESLYARATEVFRAARESVEETGNNTLCLALGMLTWYEADSSDVARSAPILLVPVTLQRDTRSQLFSLTLSGEETRLNATLVEKLRSDHGIALPELAELPEDDAGVDVGAVLNSFRAAVINHRRWDVASEACLANVSFAKYLMWADLEQRSTSLLESAVVAHLVNGKGARFPGESVTEPTELERRYTPADLLCPLDADASQLAAVAAAGEGKSFVLQGPPGTGKSQTITNLIAHCLAQGKRVLFVAEKMAALEVVHRRLSRIGLAPFCLELYSNKTGKQHVLGQLQAALDAPPRATPADWDAAQARLQRDRDQLNAYADALHRDRGGLTVFKALSRLTALRDATSVELQPSCSASLVLIATTTAASVALVRTTAALPESALVAWRGCELATWDLGLPQRVREAVARAQAQIDGLVGRLAELSVQVGVALPRTLDQADALGAIVVAVAEAPKAGRELVARERWAEVEQTAGVLVRAGRARDEAAKALAVRYSDDLYALDLATLRAQFDRYAGAFFLIAWWMLRGARRAMARVVKAAKPPPRQQVAEDLALAVEARDHTQTLELLDDRGRGIFGPLWDPASRDWSTIDGTIDWARRFQAASERLGQQVDVVALTAAGVIDAAAVRSGNAAQAHVAGVRAGLAELQVALGWTPGTHGASQVDELDVLRTQLEGWRAQHGFLREWFACQQATRELRAIGAGALVDAIADGRVAPADAGEVGERSALQQWLLREIAGDPSLQAFHGDPHRATVASFAAGDLALLRDTAAVVGSRLAARVPRGGGDVVGSSELGILQRELKKKSRHMPLRKLFRQIPALTARLKPCFLMSPLSVAQYLEPGAAKFDVVVFDEASQIPTHDAIGALARGDSAVVVGDSKQLPPTTFFQQTDDGKDVDEDDFVELESILDECCAAQLPAHRLDWHYRSQHEDLIAFSNHRYYDNKLNTFPSAAARVPHLGVSLRQVDGVYDKGNERSNRVEAEAVVEELVTRLLDPVQSQRSIGIVTFSQAQQKLVEDLIDRRRQKTPALEPFFERADEPVIVKNLENIQGDERDVMLFSICYGPDRTGKVAMNFGPLNRDGGERRLNVAVTRARQELVVFATLRPEQIDLTRTNAQGVRDLRTFLDYARRGPQAIAEALQVSGDATFDSPFEEEVHRKLTAKGWVVDTQVGCAGYRIDLGVRHPDQAGRYVLGVECDGAYYHSARSARERDRLRAQVLGTLGWKLHRIWSTDWWLDPDREIRKLEDAIEAARKPPPVLSVAPRPAPTAPVEVVGDGAAPAKASDPASGPSPAYSVPRLTPAVSRAAEERPLLARAPASGPLVAPLPDPSGPSGGVPYQVAAVADSRRAADDIHDAGHAPELRALMASVIAVEAPVSLTVLAKRIAPFYGISRTSQRMTTRMLAVLDDQTKQYGQILWRNDQRPSAYAGFRTAVPDARRDASDIALEEIANAAAFTLQVNVGMAHDELVKHTARALGFARTGERVAERMGEGIDLLLTRGGARRDGDRVSLLGDGGPRVASAEPAPIVKVASATPPSATAPRAATHGPAAPVKGEQPMLAFSWGYEGWGNHTAELVKMIDAVEASRGYGPPLFVDVRLRRQVRALGFREKAFEKLLGDRYIWLQGLGNVAIADHSLAMALSDPSQAKTLLDLVERRAEAGSRVIFFCSCGSPQGRQTCHRAMVVKALLAAARKRKTPLAVQEWPGGSPIVTELAVTTELMRRLRGVAASPTGGMRLPVPATNAIARAAALPHFSLMRCTSGDAECMAVTGPAIRTTQGWMYPVHEVNLDLELGALQQVFDEVLATVQLLPLGAKLDLPPRWRFEPLDGELGGQTP